MTREAIKKKLMKVREKIRELQAVESDLVAQERDADYAASTKIIEKHDTVDWQTNKDIHNKIAQDIDDLFYDLEKNHGFKVDFDTIDKIIENVITVALRRFK